MNTLTAPVQTSSTETRSERDLLKEQLLQDPVCKYLYNDDHMKCLRRIFTFSLAHHGYDWTSAEELLGKFQFPVLFGKTLPMAWIRGLQDKLREDWDKRKGNKKATCLRFVLDKVVTERIPEADLLACKKQKLTYKEVSHVYRTLRVLLVNEVEAKRKMGYSSEEAKAMKHVPNSYFLGKGYNSAQKPKKLKFPKGTTVEMAYCMGLRDGIEAARTSKKKQNDYPQQFNKATGRTLNAEKLSAIMKLLEKHNFIQRKQVPASSGKKNHFVTLYKLGSGGTVSFK